MFCIKCGKEIPDGSVCDCETQNANVNQLNDYNPQNGYNVQNGYNPQNGYNVQNGYNPQNGYNVQNGYNPQNGYNLQNGYNSQNGYYVQNGYNAPMYNQPVVQPYGTPGAYAPQVLDNASAAIKNVCGSTLALLLAIIISINAAMSLVSFFITGTAGDTDKSVQILSIVMSLIAFIPTLLIVIGTWNIYASARANELKMRTTGFTIIRGAVITYVVILSIALVIINIAFLPVILSDDVSEIRKMLGSFYYTAGFDELGSSIQAVFLVTLIILDLIFILIIVLYVKISGSLKYIRGFSYNIVKGDISMYAVIMLFILGGFSVINIISMINESQIYAAITYIFLCVIYIMLGVVLIQLKSKINRVLGR